MREDHALDATEPDLCSPDTGNLAVDGLRVREGHKRAFSSGRSRVEEVCRVDGAEECLDVAVGSGGRRRG